MYEKLPEQLKKDGRFCLWKYEERNGRMKMCIRDRETTGIVAFLLIFHCYI